VGGDPWQSWVKENRAYRVTLSILIYTGNPVERKAGGAKVSAKAVQLVTKAK